MDWLLFALSCTTAALLVLLYRHFWMQDFRRACLRMRHGQLQSAEELFQEAARWSYGGRRVVARASIAVCRIQTSEYSEAVAILEPLAAQRMPRWFQADQTVLFGYLALCLAMLGDTARAKRWLHAACERFGGMATFLVLPAIAILCREGHVGAALKRMEECWPLVSKDGLVCRRLRLFQAFAQRMVDPERHADLVRHTLLSLAPFPEKEVEFCQKHWPVLADFMREGEALVAEREAQRALHEAEPALAPGTPPAPGDDGAHR